MEAQKRSVACALYTALCSTCIIAKLSLNGLLSSLEGLSIPKAYKVRIRRKSSGVRILLAAGVTSFKRMYESVAQRRGVYCVARGREEI